ncbi:HesA/MoeB/ThiF family protein [Pelolinea submarina]|uniref:Molybdopterin/thiamine biosynthesis adenylyltransferase n=1 Tax=Pelolinea submarina TaxID=913107 RepID=A0A347ZV77_9CHLR|nr:molybdopterin-synthase adenylyltransferase MoeB [Pelolinea submarina]REG10206.1 molybdopterin/thiamine biosynthesis adenylyltransferase [Pelolinea submarina]BBB49208.1 sulfur-carrier protein adenylyltransferase/sulfurtransferase [Pelolinea submarina]
MKEKTRQEFLSEEEKTRYARHLNIPEIGEEGQRILKGASVLVVGAGGLGSASAYYLAAAGIGRLGIVDSDTVELSNLQRQILHGAAALGMPKVESAQKRLGDLNADIRIEPVRARVEQGNVKDILADYPIIVDACDNFETRYLINRACVEMGKTFIYGAVYQFYGQMSVFDAQKGPCFQCVFRKQPDAEYMRANRGVGVVGALPGMIGSLQALETIKVLLGIGSPARGRLLLADGLVLTFQDVRVEKDPDCPVCSKY